ncbi:MAG: pyridoxal phosphate-dependent decarboxylase family protein [Longimicrobiales bacterium]
MSSDILREALRLGESFLARADQLPVLATPLPEEIRAHLEDRYTFDSSVDPAELIHDVGQMLEKWAVHTVHPRYFGYFNPTPLREAIAGELVAAFYNPQLAVWSHAPAAVEIEQHVLSWVAARLGLPTSGASHFTSGGSEANLTATIAALTAKVPGYGERGLAGQSVTPTVYHSAGAHDSFTKICHMTGVGRTALRIIPVNDRLCMDAAALREQLNADRRSHHRPVMVVATAGTTAGGLIDPLEEIAAICREFDAWFHVDAAWGGAALLSATLREHFAGIELADSITCDAHKWFNVTMGAGMFFCRHPAVVQQAFRVATDYMPNLDQGSVDPFVSSAQWSRRFIGLKLFMALAALGEAGYADMIDHQAGLGALMRKKLSDAGWEHVSDSPLPVCCVTHPGFHGAPDALDQTLEFVLGRARVWISKVTFGDRTALRACVTSRLATEEDVELLVREMDLGVATVCGDLLG